MVARSVQHRRACLRPAHSTRKLDGCGYVHPGGSGPSGDPYTGTRLPDASYFECGLIQVYPEVEISFQQVASGGWIILYTAFDSPHTPGPGTYTLPRKLP